MLKILKYDRVLFCDVDDTLITFDFKTEDFQRAIKIGPKNFEKLAMPMSKNIARLKNARTRGHGVVVWSQGGYKWALEVVKALQLEEYVDLIVTKPNWIYDDLPVEQWMGPRFYSPEYDE